MNRLDLENAFTPLEAAELTDYVLREYLLNTDDLPEKRQDIACLFDYIREAIMTEKA